MDDQLATSGVSDLLDVRSIGSDHDIVAAHGALDHSEIDRVRKPGTNGKHSNAPVS